MNLNPAFNSWQEGNLRMVESQTKRYFHSVQLIEEKCKGCVNCIKHCPTEAIRVRDGKARIHEIKCVDCGECIRHCPNQAKTAVADTLDKLSQFKYTIALPAPALYGQFSGGVAPERILAGLLHLGFDDVYEVAYAAEMVSGRIREVLAEPGHPKPLLSSSCPVVVRLIQVRFPEFIENIVPVAPPIRVAACMARKEKSQQLGIPEDEIGLFFISPCPGKVSDILDPVGYDHQYIDGAIPISEVYPKLRTFVYNASNEEVGKALRKSSGIGIGWGRCGGEIMAIGAKKHISVDGIHHVIQILEELSHGRLLDMDYIEMLACVGGCVGGVLAVDNPFISRRRIRDLAVTDTNALSDEQIAKRQARLLDEMDRRFLDIECSIEPRPTLPLDTDMSVAIQKLEQLEEILETLPGLDCGSCGAPNCRALAEDIVRGLATNTDCIFILRKRVHQLADELLALAAKVPPAMGLEKEEKETIADVTVEDSERTTAGTKD
jgi:iron only hydrogenase large subunit-like protein